MTQAVVEADPSIAETSTSSAGALTAVPCDGDGTTGYRVQAMYVVEAGKPNRFAALQSSLKLWAAGVDEVFSQSAATTGGVRHVRFVTEPAADGTCEASVLNVEVPAGATADFASTIAAVKALGYRDPTRKYLMWTDANALCGVAQQYPDDSAADTNSNNGRYPMFARVDNACWGLGDSAGTRSVEAHELAHNLGGVQNSAPNATGSGHCNDESDTLCYNDGGPSAAVVEKCSPEQEFLLDCNSDDYFSTDPAVGSYLATHWNVANSRFLIDGGRLGAGVAPILDGSVNRTNVGFGSPVAVSARLQMPDGEPVAGVRVAVKLKDGSGAGSLLGSAVTSNDGSISVTVSPAHSGEMMLATSQTSALAAAEHSLGQVMVGSWTPSLQFNAFKSGKFYQFSGSVARSYLAERSPAAQVPVDVVLTSTSGTTTTIASAVTTSTGSWTASVNAGVVGTSGSLQAVVRGVTGYLDGASASVKLGRK
ncbi:hypothetical protein G7072_00115 [Nocardioides sp. HDW12B]|uniref:hypothetical protein n=1 Tax=Nocardioides sp. HDW12B TaxID=2714939 RepID=UPI00140E88BC|nr:hypothetical protein [Nocardioides sp. HDW12B]QIK64948.1 hypothetical protein G7072_00115 [Nocardioides sp. HDW12B]